VVMDDVLHVAGGDALRLSLLRRHAGLEDVGSCSKVMCVCVAEGRGCNVRWQRRGGADSNQPMCRFADRSATHLLRRETLRRLLARRCVIGSCYATPIRHCSTTCASLGAGVLTATVAEITRRFRTRGVRRGVRRVGVRGPLHVADTPPPVMHRHFGTCDTRLGDRPTAPSGVVKQQLHHVQRRRLAGHRNGAERAQVRQRGVAATTSTGSARDSKRGNCRATARKASCMGPNRAIGARRSTQSVCPNAGANPGAPRAW
jgi:hypothetical protein